MSRSWKCPITDIACCSLSGFGSQDMAYVNRGKFRVQIEAEQQIWNECSRLITNAVIYYNTVLLSRVYYRKLAAEDHAATDMIQGMSPVA